MGNEDKDEKEDKKEDLFFLLPPLEPLESPSRKKVSVMERLASNPAIPIGMLATCFALGNGLRHLYKRNTRQQQQMMRLRVGAQGFTVLAIIGGCVYSSLKDK